jgi:putative addiction module component (TIGR02574 family)
MRAMNKKLLQDILELSVAERIQLVQDIWDSIAQVSESFNLTEAQKQEIENRRNEYLKNPSAGIPWEQVKARINL